MFYLGHVDKDGLFCFLFDFSRLPEALVFCLFSIQQHVSWSLGITRLICNLSFEPVLPSDFQLILSLLFIKTSAFPPSVIFVGMRDAAAEERQMSS